MREKWKRKKTNISVEKGVISMQKKKKKKKKKNHLCAQLNT